MTTNSFLEEATARGFVFQCTDTEALSAAMQAGPITAYIGFDCTADSLHVGSLVQIMILRLLQKHGHKPLVLLGGGTTRIGDPSGKDESVKLRLDREQPLTFLEFNYMILQSYDFRELSRRHGVTLQIGGSDQWGNIVAGMELTRRTDARPVYGLTTPLITTVSGGKMGKTAQGAIWLTTDRLSAYDYWQFWRNTDDADVGRFLRLFTDLPLAETSRLEALGGAEINEAKKVLATRATALAHGSAAAAQAADTARRAFEEGEAAASLPTMTVAADELAAGIPAFRLFALAGLAASNAEARRLIRGGGARVNDVAVTEEGQVIATDLLRDGAIKLSAGRKQHRLIRTT
jgi:tyrosyl-tRNA synthetase